MMHLPARKQLIVAIGLGMLPLAAVAEAAASEHVAVFRPDMSYAAAQGEKFAAAYTLFAKAPRRSYNYEPAIKAFRMLADNPGLSEEKRHNACLFLCLTEFFSLKFQDAARDSGLLFQMIQKSPSEADRRLAKEIVDQCSAGQIKNIAQLRETIFAHSRFKILLPNDPTDVLLDEARGAAALDDADILAKIRESKVYDIAAKTAQGRPFDAERAPVAKLIERNVAALQRADDNAFYTTVGLLALDSSRLHREMPHLKPCMDLAVCAHNLRQMGIAFHLYLLDHQMCFPPLQSEGKTTFEGKEVAVTTCYPDMLKPYFDLPRGNVMVNDHCWEIPADSVFQCPAAPAPWKLSGSCQYGYHDIWPNSMSSGKMKFSAIKPEHQLLVADVCYFGSPNGMGISRLYSLDTLCPRHGGYVNVLYADGHVNAEDMNWLWTADGNGIPWNSNKPHAVRTATGSWPYKPPATDD